MRIIKKLVLSTIIIGASLFSILVVFGFIYQDRIINSVQTELNKNLNAEIKVGKIELSFISNFPLVSVNLKNVVGFESKSYSAKPDTLFVFETFDLAFNILEVIEGQFILNEIEASNGFVNLEINKKGVENYLLFVSNSDDSSAFSLNLKKVRLDAVTAGYNDLRDSDAFKIHFVSAVANGSFTDSEIHSALYGDIIVKELKLENTNYLTNEKANVDIGIGIDLESGAFQISRGFLTLRENYKFEVKGKTNAKKFHYTFDAKNLKINKAKTLIPKKHLNNFQDYLIEGDLNVFLEIKRDEGREKPSVSGEFDVKRGSFTYVKTGQAVKITTLNGTFNLGRSTNLETTQIKISEFELATKEAKAKGYFQVKNLTHPVYKIQANGVADLFEISKLADLGENFGMQGMADFDLSVTGRFSENDTITDEDIRTIKGNANIELSEAMFRIKGLPEIEKVSSSILVNHQDVVFSNFRGLVAQSPTEAEAKLHNWLRYVLKKSKRLDISGDIQTEMFDLADWETEETEMNEAFTLPEYLSYVGRVKMGTLKLSETVFSNVSSNVRYFPRKLELTKTFFDAFNGRIFTNSTLQQWANGFEIFGEVNTRNVDLQQVLKTYKNFGLTTITHEQIKGDFHSSFAYKFSTNDRFAIALPTLEVDGDLMLLNGEVIENKLLYSIPKDIESNKVIALFVNLDLFEKRLHHIKFDTLSNHLTIKNEIITIPDMMMKSTALNIRLEGTHTFNNEMNYYMNFNLNNVLGKKEPIKDEYGFIEDDEDGNKNMYLHVYTKNGEVIVDVDKYGSKKILELGGSKELNAAKSILKKELGLFKNDTSVVIKEKEESFDYDLDFGEFSDTLGGDSVKPVKVDTAKADSSVFGKFLKKKKKKKKEDNFEEWDVEDEDF